MLFRSGKVEEISAADDIGSNILFAPESKQTCNVFANSSTFPIVPPILILPNITKFPNIDFFKAQLHNATNVASEMYFEAPTPCKSYICNK